MSTLVTLLRRVFTTDPDAVVYECRNCGTTLDDIEQPRCPNCESDEIVRHNLT